MSKYSHAYFFLRNIMLPLLVFEKQKKEVQDVGIIPWEEISDMFVNIEH